VANPGKNKVNERPPADDAKEQINWQYGICPLNSEPDNFGPFKALVSLWRQKRCSELALPRKSEFDFLDFRGWWGNIAIATFEHDPFDVRFTLWGTKLTEWWGVDYTGKSLGSLSQSPDLWKLVEGKYFEEMIADPFIGLVEGKLDQHGRKHINVLGLDLPLSDGQSISHVLMAHIAIGADENRACRIPAAPIGLRF
jgi:hypothetical protein